MIIWQRDIVEIAFYTGRKPETHPAIIVSTDEIFELEGFFYAILLSTKNIIPDYTFQVSPTMINGPKIDRVGFAVCDMIQQFVVGDVISRTGASLKAEAFKRVVKQAQQVVFGIGA